MLGRGHREVGRDAEKSRATSSHESESKAQRGIQPRSERLSFRTFADWFHHWQFTPCTLRAKARSARMGVGQPRFFVVLKTREYSEIPKKKLTDDLSWDSKFFVAINVIFYRSKPNSLISNLNSFPSVNTRWLFLST
jgi:hypothetical protein